MQKVSFGKLDTRMPIEGKDELGSLDMSFNRMVSGVQSLVQEVEQSERLKKEAELKAFHYQINPHLLFNTLNSIQWKARLEGADDIRQMLYHLTMVLEGNLDISQELITVGRELRMIEHFLKIQEIRYGNVFSYELNCEDSLKQYLIPQKNELLLTLRDNGAGMTEEKRERLLVPDPNRRGRGGLGVQ
ncbi:hypothetical protein PC115_g25642, partial [Phytophthora cactorum]